MLRLQGALLANGYSIGQERNAAGGALGHNPKGTGTAQRLAVAHSLWAAHAAAALLPPEGTWRRCSSLVWNNQTALPRALPCTLKPPFAPVKRMRTRPKALTQRRDNT